MNTELLTGSAPSAAHGAPLLELRNAEFVVGEKTILQPTTVAVPAGRILGVIGHNGSGKSTLGKILARQMHPTKGQLLLRGAPTEHMASREFAREVAYLPQYMPAASGTTVEELVSLGRYPWLGAFRSPGQEDKDRVWEAMQITNVMGLSKRLVDTLSGGERQRVWLATLLAQQAHCFILDEPTSALDIRHQVLTLELLRQLVTKQGIGIVVILHDVYMAGKYCDDLMALRQGKVIASGNRDQILTTEVLREIYDMNVDVLVHPVSGDRVISF